jgi:hypothetical protein
MKKKASGHEILYMHDFRDLNYLNIMCLSQKKKSCLVIGGPGLRAVYSVDWKKIGTKSSIFCETKICHAGYNISLIYYLEIMFTTIEGVCYTQT